jgi:hypothetical protein
MWISSKYYNGKIRLYEHKNGDITYYVRYKKDGKVQTKKVGTKSNGWNEKRAYNERKKLDGSYNGSIKAVFVVFFEKLKSLFSRS